MRLSKFRKSILAASAVAISALVLSACASPNSQSPTTVSAVNEQPEVLASSAGKLDVTLTAAETIVPFGSSTRWAMTYNGKTTGPTLVIRPGDHVNITLVNKLNQATSLHTHGLHVAPSQDDPFIMVEPGQSHTYSYDVPQNHAEGTFWYHPHMHGITAEQVASGLSGAILVAGMDADQLSSVATDRVLVINDPPITDKNPWADASNSSGQSTSDSGMAGMGDMMGGQGGSSSMSGMGNGASGTNMMTAMMGRTGPKLLTNGFEGIKFTDSKGKLELLHLVNATASSRLKFTFTGAKMLQISNDGGRLPAPSEISGLELASGTRADVILVPGPQGGVLSAQRLSNEVGGSPIGNPETIATVGSDAGTSLSALPSTFMMAVTRDLFSATEKPAATRIVTLSGHMPPTIDGKLFDPSVVNFTAKKGTVEEWTIKNASPMYHPIHLHTWGFQIKGEAGWHDTVVIPPNSEQVIRIAFDDYAGTTVLHCHILDHEDTGMMAIIKVQ